MIVIVTLQITNFIYIDLITTEYVIKWIYIIYELD